MLFLIVYTAYPMVRLYYMISLTDTIPHLKTPKNMVTMATTPPWPKPCHNLMNTRVALAKNIYGKLRLVLIILMQWQRKSMRISLKNSPLVSKCTCRL
jgi:hypothetical protein